MLQRPRPAVLVLLAALLLAALAVPFLAGTYGIKFTTRIIILAIFVLSLDFLIGITGLVSFGHAMFFGLGAYVVYFISPQAAGANALVAFPLAMLAAAMAALGVGALAVLTRAPANGGPPQARVPVSIQNRQLSIGPIPVLRLPVIAWN